MTEVIKGVKKFFEEPGTGESLSLFRILISLLAIVWAAAFYADIDNLTGLSAWVNQSVNGKVNAQGQPDLETIARLLSVQNPDHVAMIPYIVFYCFLTGVGFLLLGLFTRIAAFVSWLCFWIIIASMDMMNYGCDHFIYVALLYTTVMPVSKVYSLDSRFGFTDNRPVWTATLSKRVIQFHLCVVYLVSGVTKLFSPMWLDGNAIWYTLNFSDWGGRVFNFLWLHKTPLLAQILALGTITIEIGYTVFMWVPRLRSYWFILVLLLHAGIGIFMGMPLFATIMIIFSFTAWYDGIMKDAVWSKTKRSV